MFIKVAFLFRMEPFLVIKVLPYLPNIPLFDCSSLDLKDLKDTKRIYQNLMEWFLDKLTLKDNFSIEPKYLEDKNMDWTIYFDELHPGRR